MLLCQVVGYLNLTLGRKRLCALIVKLPCYPAHSKLELVEGNELLFAHVESDLPLKGAKVCDGAGSESLCTGGTYQLW